MLIKNPLLLIVLLFISTLTIGCNGGKMEEKTIQFPSIQDVPASSWAKLAKKKIYFGHQSVGNNILEGVKDLMKENSQINLNIVETSDLADFKIGLFAHSMVGKNEDPRSKIDAFASFMEDGIGSKADIAFFKFCFVDVYSSTDVKKLFEDYKNRMAQLKEKYNNITFVHFTVPLTTTNATWKTWIKKLVRKKDIWEYDHNVARNEFNQLLRNEYNGKESVFDLAKIESTFSNGRRSSFRRNGKIHYALVPEYSDDGSHLNKIGRKKAAEQLLILLASIE